VSAHNVTRLTRSGSRQFSAHSLRGAQPTDIPFQEVAEQKLVPNHDVAAKLHIKFPADVEKAAQA
jgi:ABC-type uncharacterized transport system substrate-binding protein